MNSESVTFRWKNIRVTVPRKGKTIQILERMSGIAKPGRLLAIMGASGSGKTTLLNSLTYRSSSTLNVEGEITINGRPFIGTAVQKVSAYVQQHDVFFGILTVREHLLLQAMLRLHRNISDADKEKRVDDVMGDLGLKDQANIRIGNPETAKSLSGGERKRLSLASEILTNPSVLFCDEPTSGLDSFMAENVVLTLKAMAQKGKTIVSTIHQPSSKIFSLFDDLLLVGKGRLAYLGPLEKADDFFSSQGLPCPNHFNWAEHCITALSVIPGNEDDSKKQINRLADAFAESSLANGPDGEIIKASDLNIISVEDKMETPAFFTKLYYIGWRSFIVELRNLMQLGFKTGPTIFMAVFIGLMYLQQDNNQKGVQNLSGGISLIIAMTSYSIGFSVIVTFPLEFPIVKRDIENQMYSVFVYYLTKSVAELLIFVTVMIIASTIMYWMMGFRPEVDSWLIFTATILLVTVTAVGYSYIIAGGIANVTIASALFAPMVVPWMVYGGSLLNDDSYPIYFIWLEYMSWYKYSSSILMTNQWKYHGKIECEYANFANKAGNSSLPPTGRIDFPLNGSSIGNKTTTTTLVSQAMHSDCSVIARCFRTGEDVLLSYNYHHDTWKRDVLGLFALNLGFRILAFIFLYLRMHGVNRLSGYKRVLYDNSDGGDA